MELQPIQNLIHEIRGYKVMLDFDIAALYGVENRRLKEQVRRNIDRFPDDFMFQLTKSEWTELVAICDNLRRRIVFFTEEQRKNKEDMNYPQPPKGGFLSREIALSNRSSTEQKSPFRGI
jgi:hypothetical protein